MTHVLVVVRTFGAYRRGDLIRDPGTIAAILAGEHAACVVRVQQGNREI